MRRFIDRIALVNPGIAGALGAALLFGAGTPLAKALLGSFSALTLAGLLYLGSGLGLALYRLARRAPAVHLPRNERAWFAGAIVAGGIVGPVLLMTGLSNIGASAASLLLNAEAVFTVLIAWFVFREGFDRRIALGVVCIVAGALVLSWPDEWQLAGVWPQLCVIGACLAWAIDNNLTRKVSLSDATWIAAVKGGVAGSVNLALALALGDELPAWPAVAAAMAVGLLAYGVSLSLFVVGLRHLGTARTGAYFSIAPFVGALIALAFGEPATPTLLLAGALMAVGVWLHLSERHSHLHVHPAMSHEHEHEHDAHHQHAHDRPVAPGTRHSHAHRHEALEHAHAHYPDAHHRHDH
jgi:drug/metabolite transporter (DMT)-like permease